MRAYRRLQASRRACALTSLAICLVFFVAGSVAWVPTGLYDDWSISNALSSNWGEDEGLCLFLNAALSQAIFWLNSTFTQVNWFFMLERLSGAAALFTVSYLSLTRLRPAFAATLIGGFVLLVVPGCTYETNFTYVAGACVCAGGMALLMHTAHPDGPNGLVVAGIALMALGALWRWTMFVVAVPIFGVAALLLAFDGTLRFGRGSLGQRCKSLLPYLAALVVFAALFGYNAAAWKAEPWNEWYEFNELRSEISDYSYGSYDDYAEGLAQIGVSKNDYQLIKSWVSEDPEFFDLARLQQIRDVINAQRSDLGRVGEAFLGYVPYTLTSARIVALLAMLAASLMTMIPGKGRKLCVAILALALVEAAAMYAFGRLPARVHLPLWMCAAVAVAAMSSAYSAKAAAEAGPNLAARLGWRVTAAKLAGVVATGIAACSLVFVVGTCATNLNLQRVQALVNEPAYQPKGAVSEYLDEHRDAVYALNVASNAQLVYSNVMMVPLSTDVLNRSYSIGGWAAHAPYAAARNARIGAANPIRALVDNENVLFVAGDEQAAERLCTYLREHYYEDAQFREVDVVGKASTGAVFKAYDFYRGSASSSGAAV